MDYAIETFSLTKIFSDWWGRQKVRAVDDLNLKLYSNEVFGLLGPNGSGKTTTIKMMLGLLHPTKGRCVVLGGHSADPKVNERIGFLPEESYLYKYLSARETLDFYGRLFGLPRKVRKLRTEALLEMVGLKAVANRPVGTYSKGMARRIGLAQALINDPDLLILDEPTTGLDPIGTRQIKDLISELADRGKTILLCSHLLADVEDVCDRISILYGGKIQSEGKVEELLKQSEKTEIKTSRLSDSALAKIKDIIEHENGDEMEVSSPMEKLETFFVRTVAEAQKEKKPTSGAYSTTQIGGFLANSDKSKSILDKLVTANVESGDQQDQGESTDTETETVEQVTKESSYDEGVLQGLTEDKGEPETSATDRPEEESAEQEVEEVESEEIKTDILDQLTGNEPDVKTETPHSPEQEDDKDA